MLKIEFIWRELLFRVIEQKDAYFTLTELAQKFKLSTSVVSHALIPLRGLGIIKIGKLKSRTVDVERLLFFWATRRNVQKDVIYKTYSTLPVMEREASMPPRVIPTAYSFCRLYLNEVASDYENIYFYTKDMTEVEPRFPKVEKKVPNIFVLSEDPYLASYRKPPLAQVFADLWNLPEWYAKDFSEALLLKIKGELGL